MYAWSHIEEDIHLHDKYIDIHSKNNLIITLIQKTLKKKIEKYLKGCREKNNIMCAVVGSLIEWASGLVVGSSSHAAHGATHTPTKHEQTSPYFPTDPRNALISRVLCPQNIIFPPSHAHHSACTHSLRAAKNGK